MSDVFEHNPDDHEDPLAGPTYLVGLLGLMGLVITIGLVAALYYNVKAGKVREQVITPPRQEVRALYDQQEALLEGPPRWIDVQEQGTTVKRFIIPVDRAMELVQQEYGSDQ